MASASILNPRLERRTTGALQAWRSEPGCSAELFSSRPPLTAAPASPFACPGRLSTALCVPHPDKALEQLLPIRRLFLRERRSWCFSAACLPPAHPAGRLDRAAPVARRVARRVELSPLEPLDSGRARRGQCRHGGPHGLALPSRLHRSVPVALRSRAAGPVDANSGFHPRHFVFRARNHR